MTPRPPRVVLDTNIYVSALAVPGGRCDDALRQIVEGRATLVLSPAILAELANVLERKFKWPRDRTLEACRDMAVVADIVRPVKRIHILKDDPDNRILECALAGKADFIVTGDRHLLDLKQFDAIRILSLAEFRSHLDD